MKELLLVLQSGVLQCLLQRPHKRPKGTSLGQVVGDARVTASVLTSWATSGVSRMQLDRRLTNKRAMCSFVGEMFPFQLALHSSSAGFSRA